MASKKKVAKKAVSRGKKATKGKAPKKNKLATKRPASRRGAGKSKKGLTLGTVAMAGPCDCQETCAPECCKA